jgi:hypothetical protein
MRFFSAGDFATVVVNAELESGRSRDALKGLDCLGLSVAIGRSDIGVVVEA